jgi:hypothetical protein
VREHAVALESAGFDGLFSLALPPEIAAVRDRALTVHHQRGRGELIVPELALIDAAAWAAHTPEEDWLIWRARRCAERLHQLPLDLEAGEGIVGKPHVRNPEQYKDLVVRVAGYSDYFVKLGPTVQDEIIARTEHVWR